MERIPRATTADGSSCRSPLRRFHPHSPAGRRRVSCAEGSDVRTGIFQCSRNCKCSGVRHSSRNQNDSYDFGRKWYLHACNNSCWYLYTNDGIGRNKKFPIVNNDSDSLTQALSNLQFKQKHVKTTTQVCRPQSFR